MPVCCARHSSWITVLTSWEIVSNEATVRAATVQAPLFVVDPYWPKPLPNHWITGSTIGLSIDAEDHVWTIHRLNSVEKNFKAADLKLGECCKTAPPVLEYDQAGNLVKSWGGPGEGSVGLIASTVSRLTIRATSGSAVMVKRIPRF